MFTKKANVTPPMAASEPVAPAAPPFPPKAKAKGKAKGKAAPKKSGGMPANFKSEAPKDRSDKGEY